MEILPNYYWFNVQGINGFITKFIPYSLQHPIKLSGEPTLLVSSPPRRAIPRESCNSFTGSNTTPLIGYNSQTGTKGTLFNHNVRKNTEYHSSTSFSPDWIGFILMFTAYHQLAIIKVLMLHARLEPRTFYDATWVKGQEHVHLQ